MNLNSRDLLKYSEDHLSYEIEMLVSLSKFNPSLFPPELQQILINMRIESFVMHLRNLIDFLYPNKKEADDVLAEHFFAEVGSWEKIRPSSLSNSLHNARTLAHKKLMHLTTKRLVKDSWNTEFLVSEIKPILRQFYEVADRGKLHPKGLSFLN